MKAINQAQNALNNQILTNQVPSPRTGHCCPLLRVIVGTTGDIAEAILKTECETRTVNCGIFLHTIKIIYITNSLAHVRAD